METEGKGLECFESGSKQIMWQQVHLNMHSPSKSPTKPMLEITVAVELCLIFIDTK